MYAGEAVRLNEVPLMPGAAACAVAASSVAANISAAKSRVMLVSFFMFIALMAALLIDPNFGHQSAKVLRVVRQVIKIGGVEVVGAFWHAGGIENHIDR